MNTYFDDFDLDIQKVTYDGMNNDRPCEGPESADGGPTPPPPTPNCGHTWTCPTYNGVNCTFTRTNTVCVNCRVI